MADKGKEFPFANPPRDITLPSDPQGLTVGAYPRSLYKFAKEDGEGVVVVAWAGKEPIYNEHVVAADAKAAADYEAQGYAGAPVLKAAKK